MSDITVPGKNLNENMKVVITNEDTLANLANQNLTVLSKMPGFNINSSKGILKGINNQMRQTALKAGCCMRAKDDNTGKLTVVRTPLQSSTTNPSLLK